MNYEKIYLNLVLSRQLLTNRKRKDGNYYEDHHIYPRCFGGNKQKENMVLLTAKEHFIAHLLLTECYKNEDKKAKMVSALMYLAKQANKRKDPEKSISASQYEFAKKLFNKEQTGKPVPTERRKNISKALKGKYTGEKNHMFGKKRPDLSKRNKKSKGKVYTAENIEAFRNTKKNYPILQYSLSNVFIREYSSINEAVRINKFKSGGGRISKCCRNLSKSFMNFKWQFKFQDHLQKKLRKPLKKKAAYNQKFPYRGLAVQQFSLNDEFIAEYPSILAAKKNIKKPGRIELCCKNKILSTCGYKWKYKN